MALYDEDRDLVLRMRAGEEAAFSQFVERYSRALYRFTLARLEGDRDLTRETVQTALTKALAKLDTYRGEASLLTWLCACCRNEILMHLRRRRAAPWLVDLDEGIEPAEGSYAQRPRDPERAMLRREEAHQVHVALDTLPRHYAQALEWKYVERAPVVEIAARLGMRPKAAESLLTRARQAFRRSYLALWSESEEIAGAGASRAAEIEEELHGKPARSEA